MNEHENPSLEQEALQFSKKPKRKKPIWLWSLIAVCALAVILIGVGAGILIYNVANQPSPLEKTLQAVFPSAELLGELLENGGTLTLDGSLGEDMDETLTKEPLDFSVELALSERASKLTLGIGSNDTMMDVSYLLDKKGAQLSSELFLDGEAYNASYEGLLEQIDASPFAPNSGTSYAMSEGNYTQLRRMLSYMEHAENAEEIFGGAWENIWKVLYSKVEVTQEAKYIELTDYEALAKVTEITFDQTIVEAISESVMNEWKGNAELRALLTEQAILSGELYSGEEDLEEALKAELDDLKEAFADIKFDGKLRWAERYGYLVAVELELDLREKVGTKYKDSGSVDFSLIFSENPGQNPEFDVSLTYTEGKTVVYKLTASFDRTEHNGTVKNELEALIHQVEGDSKYTVRVLGDLTCRANGLMNLDASVAVAPGHVKLDNDGYKDAVAIEMTGTYELTEKTLAVSLERLSVFAEDARIAKLNSSRFAFKISAEKPKVKRAWGAEDMTKLDTEELADIEKATQERLTAFAEEINKLLGDDYMQYEWCAETEAAIELSDAPYAYDAKTGRLFVRKNDAEENATRKIYVFDAESMVLLDTLTLDTDCELLAADAGQLAVANSDSKNVLIYDAATLKKIKTLTLSDKPKVMALDGDNLLTASRTTLYRTFVSGDATDQIQTARGVTAITVDREHHVACAVTESGVTLFATETGKTVKSISRYVAQAYPCYNGTAFMLDNNYYGADGSTVKLNTMTQGRKHSGYTVEAVLYTDAKTYITYEVNSAEGLGGYFVYSTDNGSEPIGELEIYACREIIKLADGMFLVCDADYGYLSFSTVSVSENWTFGRSE